MPSPTSPAADDAAIQVADRAAFEHIYADERQWLLSRAGALLDRRLQSIVDPEDLLQDTFCLACRKLGVIRVVSHSELRGWLEQIMKNRAIDLYRRHFRTRKRIVSPASLSETVGTTSNGSAVAIADCVIAPGSSPSSRVNARETVSRLRRLLDALSPEHRRVIELLKLERVPLPQVAEIMQRTPAAIRQLLTRALKKCQAFCDIVSTKANPA